MLFFEGYQKRNKANKIYSEAITLEQENSDTPYGVNKLNQALLMYKKCHRLSKRSKYLEDSHRCQKKIDKCRTFLKLVNTGKNKFQQELFQEALANFIEAKQFFVTTELQIEIEKCEIKIKNIENKANELYSKAKILEQENQQNPYNIEQLKQACLLYDRCYQLVDLLIIN